MEKLKSIKKKNHAFKNQIKKIEREIKERIKINPLLADAENDFKREEKVIIKLKK